MPSAHDGIRHWIELLPAEGIAPAVSQRVTEQRVFRSGERIRLHFETNVAGHITLIAGGSSGRRQKLFPLAAAGLGDDRLEAYTPRILPAENAWIRFDDQPAEERIEVYFEPDRPTQDGIPRPPEAAGGGPLRRTRPP